MLLICDGWRRGSVVIGVGLGELSLIYGSHVITSWVRCPAMGQPTRPTQPSIPPWITRVATIKRQTRASYDC